MSKVFMSLWGKLTKMNKHQVDMRISVGGMTFINSFTFSNAPAGPGGTCFPGIATTRMAFGEPFEAPSAAIDGMWITAEDQVSSDVTAVKLSSGMLFDVKACWA